MYLSGTSDIIIGLDDDYVAEPWYSTKAKLLNRSEWERKRILGCKKQGNVWVKYRINKVFKFVLFIR